jgi:hypothetical protein
MKKILHLLKKNKVVVEFGFWGTKTMGEQLDDDITINLIHCLAPTIIHECLHYLFPDKKEKQILTLENSYIRRLTYRQQANIVKAALLNDRRNYGMSNFMPRKRSMR